MLARIKYFQSNKKTYYDSLNNDFDKYNYNMAFFYETIFSNQKLGPQCKYCPFNIQAADKSDNN